MGIPNFQGATSLSAQEHVDHRRFCPRCARPAVRVTNPDFEVWNCPFGHGEIYRAEIVKGPELHELTDEK